MIVVVLVRRVIVVVLVRRVICVSDPNKQSISNQQQEIKSTVINMLENWNSRYFSHNNNIKCVGSTIKYIGFELIHYAVNLNVGSSFIIC